MTRQREVAIERSKDGSRPLLFGLTVFLSAFLLFLVQLIMGKALLPWFGGAPSVWTTCMLFFQVSLLAGYAYAHGSVSRLSPAGSTRRHAVLVAGASAALALAWMRWGVPLLPHKAWRPAPGAEPVGRILVLLLLACGFPFLVLSATAPLLQAWFTRVHTRSPYRLYALSNAGSLLALLSYPFVFEPLLSLNAQAIGWAGGFVVFAASCLACARVSADPEASQRVAAEDAAASPRPGAQAMWLGLAACASMLLLATTNQMCQEVAVVPFLWVLPLALYLLTFIICFNSPRWYVRPLYGALLLVALPGIIYVLTHTFTLPILLQVGVYSATLFVACMVCHGELAGMAPTARHLTRYYLLIATGGAIGGLLVGLAAPYLFKGYWEFQVALWLCTAFFVALRRRERAAWVGQAEGPALAAAALALPAAALGFRFTDYLMEMLLAVAGVTIAAGIARSLKRNALSVAGAVALMASLTLTLPLTVGSDEGGGVVRRDRNFYGVLRVIEVSTKDAQDHRYMLMHGRTAHGCQFLAPERQRQPSGYLGLESGGAMALMAHPRRQAGPLKIGVLGMGVGTMAAYGREGDLMRFYEINPRVVSLASGPSAVFTFIPGSKAHVESLLGDARLTLERELAENGPLHYDVLIIDVFNGDSIPMHLLTREAFALYLAHLRRPDGILAIHVSNRYLDLKPEVFKLAQHHGVHATYIRSVPPPPDWPSQWMICVFNAEFLRQPPFDQGLSYRGDLDAIPLWTDDYSNLLTALRKPQSPARTSPKSGRPPSETWNP